MTAVRKNFGSTAALTDGRFELRKGEIHSIIGENGAGKSTLMKILYGLHSADEGEITVKGSRVGSKWNSRAAIRVGVGMVHQEFMLIKEFDSLANISLGFERVTPKKTLDWNAVAQEVEHYAREYHMDVDFRRRVADLSVSDQQKVEIIKVLYRKADILILDEPTAVLSPQESARLFNTLKALLRHGCSIVFISHKFSEVIAISDRITVMRQGRWVDTIENKDVDADMLAEKMIGKVLRPPHRAAAYQIGPDPTLELRHVCTAANTPRAALKDLSLRVFPGEIVGVAGVSGNGQSELAEAISGLRALTSGEIRLMGKSTVSLDPDQIRQLGLSHIPEDRNLLGLNRAATAKDNIASIHLHEKRFNNGWWLNSRAIGDYAAQLFQKYQIHPPEPSHLASAFSGGNAQKLVVAREITADKPFLLIAQPTRGVDIGAIEVIHRIILENREQGKAILLISSELDEIFALADRIVVLHSGRLELDLPASQCDEELVGRAMMGAKDAVVED